MSAKLSVSSAESGRTKQRFGGTGPWIVATFALFASPAAIDLIRTTWRTEAGSLAPIVVALGGYTLWRDLDAARGLSRPGSPAVWIFILIAATAILLFASAAAVPSLGAIAVWLGGVAALYALHGQEVLRRLIFPLVFLLMIVPLPYSLSIAANGHLRTFVAGNAVALARMSGIDAAVGHGIVAVGPYVLAIENACAGANSTLTLVSISVLYAYWVHQRSPLRAWFAGALAIPIAMAANIARVVALLALVEWQGSAILSTAVHPLSGFVSFLFAAGMLWVCDRAAMRWDRGADR
ncbi:MAG: exosortase/archaeosortase family protein [Erythrobacter sp.]